MLKEIENQIQEVKKITQGVEEIEVEDDLNIGQKKKVKLKHHNLNAI